ncbi:MAG: bifunctional nuclease family protein [Candidatus Omnitrophota bacterium]
MIELVLNKIKVDESRNEQLIIFREKEGARYLPVVIGMAEVNSIKMKISGIKPPRPLTHDLLMDVIQKLGGEFRHVVIDRLEKNTFYAKIFLSRGKKSEIVIDARPSDSVALALRAEVPIFVTEQVMDEAGVSEV